MSEPTIEQKIQRLLDHLQPEQKKRVFDYARALRPEGVSGQSLLRFAGAIEENDLALMSEAIAEGCETVNSDEW